MESTELMLKRVLVRTEAGGPALPFTWRFPQPSHSRRRTLRSIARLERARKLDAERPILIVEDDPDILITLSEILEFEGYAVELATNGLHGLEIIERVRPSLIMLDMRMPVMNGWDLASTLRERGVGVPILVMTAAQDARRWADEIGAQGYIEKPFHLTNLLNSIESLMGSDPNGDGSGGGPTHVH